MTLKQLQPLVAIIIAAPVDAGVVKQPIHALVNALEQESGVSSQADMNTSHGTYTEHGVAISPVQAARCSLEPLRTQVFMQGVAAAINDKVHGDKVVHILYAGTGPFATLLLPYLACHPELPVRVTLLDIHQENIEAVKKLVARWHIGHLINEYVVADATCWQPDAQSRLIVKPGAVSDTPARNAATLATFEDSVVCRTSPRITSSIVSAEIPALLIVSLIAIAAN